MSALSASESDERRLIAGLTVEARVFRVVQSSRSEQYQLRLIPAPPVPLETYIEARCLLDAADFEPAASADRDAAFTTGVAQLRRELDAHVLEELRSPSRGLIRDASAATLLTTFVQSRAHELGLDRLLGESLARDLKSSSSCLNLARARHAAREAYRTALAPVTYDVIALCPGPSGNLEAHFSFHERPSWPAAKSSRILARLDVPSFRKCLADVLRRDPELARLIATMSSETTGDLYERAVSAALSAWRDAGIENALRAFEEGRDADGQSMLLGICGKGEAE